MNGGYGRRKRCVGEIWIFENSGQVIAGMRYKGQIDEIH